MKKSIIALLIAAPLTLSLSGCVIAVGGGDEGHSMSTSFGDREYENRKQIAKIQLNSRYDDIKSQFALADFNEKYQIDGKEIKVLFYRTHRVHKDDLTTKDECTYLHFVDGVLVETGNGADYRRNISD
ncbi:MULTISPECIES: DUF3192 domain-containing protein [unclassified Colwellia]|uniref:DUF3192 domain-containing protein n=1 Tax=unclassified Colwellia TaxID=196834 RepID=UPI0015F6823F|nr:MULTISPECIES: DUF3192 domain-containing protein [unclassified Colwellia]MBA6233041.1 DUF3192 domain-containing protein [Colwellia sp. MB02u-7]MBA6236719.1 DUF3192 domain-containing protein [Colwellia sp. MB02u-11]MBA6255911.1 DUF3192 domain-containing protein [Colwellia sp. MB3u-28]MBA6262053.1 DUF3192 domain-containing protein [Colwellia sp. MB3u-41]MBA6299021.1 DUF3192 domain-containing protein [Colwellia sp. MB3u-22]